MLKNNNILCNVVECKFNDKNHYCTFDKIKITKHDAIVKNIESTDCASFQSMK